MDDETVDDEFFCAHCGNKFTQIEFGTLDMATNTPVCQTCYDKKIEREW